MKCGMTEMTDAEKIRTLGYVEQTRQIRLTRYGTHDLKYYLKV